MPKANALASLNGSSKALAGNVGKSDRPQEVHTGRWFLDLAVFPAFGGVVDYDPCAASNPAAWFATLNVTLPPAVQSLVDMLPTADDATAREIRKVLKAVYREPPQHLPGRAYVNPPFSDLEPWMLWCAERGAAGNPTLGLWPVRPGNAWWIPACKGAEITFLSARFAFEGYKAAHPEDLVLVAWNCQVPNLGKWETGRWKP